MELKKKKNKTLKNSNVCKCISKTNNSLDPRRNKTFQNLTNEYIYIYIYIYINLEKQKISKMQKQTYVNTFINS